MIICDSFRNEKTGIPVEILQVLDVCVEIPQRGVIRSLNVHVSGALFIWEYYKQWSLRSVAGSEPAAATVDTNGL
jgi:tRNA(Leu) C34 or U34 (ribose-2'-O)-methylase TrmL